MSFAFTVEEQTWNRDGKIPKRTVTKIGRLYDVSVVDTPAYDSTSIYARSIEAMELDLKTMDVERASRSLELLKRKVKIKTLF